MELGLIHWSKLMWARIIFLSPPYVRVLQIDIGFKHDVLVCSNGIAKTFENLEYVKPPNEGFVACA
jgi:hypothetical protein